MPCYNEEKSVHTMHAIISELFQNELSQYDYELIFVDDYSPDNTRAEIENICASDKKVKAVLNVKNFGYTRNVFASFLETSGDATFMVFGDLQDPPQLLPKFIKQWEQGYKVILGQKTSSRENQHFIKNEIVIL
ncbi:MAG: glycosyltransferase [Brevinemataceae bacterium]